MQTRPEFTISCGKHILELGRRTCIMGIVNVTPDSFSDGGKFYDTAKAVTHGLKLATDGADILDIGGESTRPFSEAVSEKEELRRVIPVIEKLASQVSIPISIDTTKARIARQAIEAGASIINDVGALRLDLDLAQVAAAYNVPVIVMHMKGTPKTMQVAPAYDDLLKEVKEFLADAVKRAEQSNVKRSQIIIDPGIGFGKTVAHNLLLIQRLGELRELNAPILIGPSRKAFIQNVLKDAMQVEMRADSPAVETGTQATVTAAILNGAHIIRVHDVRNTLATAGMADVLCGLFDQTGS